MSDSIGNLPHSGLLPHPLHELRGPRGILALAVIISTALLMTWIARSSSDMRALLTCHLSSLSLVACAAILARAPVAPTFERVALGADALALFAVAMLAPALVVNSWRYSNMTAALLMVIAGSAIWIGRVSSGDSQIRQSVLAVGSVVALVVVTAIWLLGESGTLSMQDATAGPVALAAVAPVFSAGAASRQPTGIALGVRLRPWF